MAPVVESFTSRAAAASVGPRGCRTSTSNASNFNGTDVAAGKLIWFNAIFKAEFTKHSNGVGEVLFTGQTVTIVDGGTTTVLHLPDSTVIFSASVTTPSTTWSGTAWVTEVPAGATDDVFLGGFLWHLPSDLPGGANPVTWAGNLQLTGAVAGLNWQWGAAAFNDFAGSDNSVVDPAPEDGAGIHAGAPGNSNMQNAIGGATGGGAANTTGSLSGTVHNSCPS